MFKSTGQQRATTAATRGQWSNRSEPGAGGQSVCLGALIFPLKQERPFRMFLPFLSESCARVGFLCRSTGGEGESDQ